MVDVPLYGFHNLLAQDNGDGTFTLKVTGISGGGGGAGADREIVLTTYRVTTAFSGASVGDIITARRVLDVTDTPTQVGGTVWYNETTSAALGSAPSAANIELAGANALTNAQLRAAAVAMSSVDLGVTTDAAAPADGTGNYSIVSAFKRALLNGAAILARLPSLLTTTPSGDAGGIPARLVGQDVISAGFSAVGASVLDTVFMQTPIVGTGVSYNQAAGALNIVAGTTTNAEFLVRSVRAFRGSQRLRFAAVLSQRIVNNNFAVLLADLIAENTPYSIVSATQVNVTIPAHGWTSQMVGQFVLLGGITGAAGVPGRYAVASIVDANTVQFTVAGWPASGSGNLTVFGRNYVRNLFTGTTATNVNMDAQRNGWATGDTVATINTTAAPGTIIANELTGRDVFFSDALRASTTTPNFTTRASRYENIPDQSVDLYVFLWSFNGTTAPASSTTLTISHLSLETFPNLPVYIQGNRAQGLNNPMPVQTQANAPFNMAQVGGTAAVSGGLAGSLAIGGTAAEDAVANQNPVVVGGVVRTALPANTVVAGDVVRATFSTSGQLIAKDFAPPDLDFVVNATVTTATQTAIRAAQAAGIRQNVTQVTYQNTNATATTLLIQDGNTTLLSVSVPANMANPVQLQFPTPLRGTAATALNYTAGTTGANILLNVTGFNSY